MKKTYAITGMTCGNCENKIRKTLNQFPAITKISVSAAAGSATLIGERLPMDAEIIKAIESAGYGISDPKRENRVGFLVVGLIVFVFLGAQLLYGNLIFDPLASGTISAGLIILYGLISSLHCVSMCGGIALSSSLQKLRGRPVMEASWLYQLGRITSYTMMGLVLGLVGQTFQLSAMARNGLLTVAGVWMILYSLQMAGIVKFSLPALPEFKLFKVKNGDSRFRPLMIGLLNGFMPCGSLQTMQVVALASRSPILGAGSMLLFGLSTAPALLAVGSLGHKLGKNNAARMKLASALIVGLLGLQMTMRSEWIAAPIRTLAANFITSETAPIVNGVQQITLTVVNGQYRLDYSTVKADIPVQMHVKTEGVTGCANPVIFSFLNRTIDVKTHPEPITFTPSEKGILKIDCTMYMVHTSIKVV